VRDKDGLVKGSPACHRAVLETVEALRKAGHECVEIQPPNGAYTGRSYSGGADLGVHVVVQSLAFFTAITSADGYEKLTCHLGPDKRVRSLICPPYKKLVLTGTRSGIGALPSCTRPPPPQ